jgi:3',5'-nucleoside bisphosphate phosphatase
MRADLHSHSTASDGTEAPAEVMRRAAAAGLDVIALTDHDTVAGHAEAAAALPPGLTLLPGTELSCRLDGHSVHVLAYLFDRGQDELAGEMAELRESRLFRARAMVDKLAAMGVPLTWDEVSEVAAGVVPTVQDAFGPAWLGPGGRVHVPRYALDPVRAIRLVTAAGGVTVLAHPRGSARGWRTPAEVIAELADAGLTGIEVRHPQHDERERALLGELAARLGLLVSGGSDDHGGLTGYRIGTEIAPIGAYEQLVERATGAVPITAG